jgi:hypothetical protein
VRRDGVQTEGVGDLKYVVLRTLKK